MANEAHAKQRTARVSEPLRRRGTAWPDAASRSPQYDAEIPPLWDMVPPQRLGPSSRRDTALRRTLAGADVVATMLALVLALAISGWSVHLRPTAILLAPFVVLAAKTIGLYDRDQHILRKTTIDELPSLVYLAVLFALTVWLAESVLLVGHLDRADVFALVVAGFAFGALGRLVARFLVAVLTAPERCIILGDEEDAARLTHKLQTTSGVRAVVAGRIGLDFHLDVSPASTGPHGPHGPRGGSVVGSLAQVIAEERIDRVIIAPDGHDSDEVLQVIRLVKTMGVKVSVLPRLLEVVGSSSTFEDVDGLMLLGLRQYGVSKSSQVLKRLMDVAGASIGIVVLAPLLTMLVIAVKLDSAGPVLFRQRRIGRRGEEFWMLKFRSMIPHAEAIKDELRHRNEVQGGLFKIADDPRMTRAGRFLRRTSLDELPQLFNVLRGNMSLVGPRPLVQDEDALIEGWQRRRLAVKPGMTGLWQIFGSSRIPMNEMVKIDYLYGANWSIWLDLKILLRTVPYLLRRQGL